MGEDRGIGRHGLGSRALPGTFCLTLGLGGWAQPPPSQPSRWAFPVPSHESEPATIATLTHQAGYTSGGRGVASVLGYFRPNCSAVSGTVGLAALSVGLWGGGGHTPRNIHKKCNPLPRAHVSLTCLQPVGLQLTLGLTCPLPPETPTIPSCGGLWSCPSTSPPRRGRGLVDSLS